MENSTTNSNMSIPISRIDMWRYKIQKKLSHFSTYLYLKDNLQGLHEADILRIVNGWKKHKKYKLNEEEKKLFNKMHLKAFSYVMAGFCIPVAFLIIPPLKKYAVKKKRRLTYLFGTGCFIGWNNYHLTHTDLVYDLLQLNNSPIAYCTFQIMCQPQYKRIRMKWQNQYNLSNFAYRYQNFDLYQAMQSPNHHHHHPISDNISNAMSLPSS